MRLDPGNRPDDMERPTPEQMHQIMRRHGPLPNEIPGEVAFVAVLGRTEKLAVALIGARVYSTGVQLALAIRLRRLDADEVSLLDGIHRRRRGAPNGDGLLLGVAYPDGRTAANVGWHFPQMPPAQDVPTLSEGSSGGGDTEYDADYWLTPMPPPGDLTIICAWPQRGIAETRTVIPAPLLAAAAAQPLELWPWELPRDRVERPEPLPPELPPGWFSDVGRADPETDA